jgi:cytidylate kinase
MIVTIDGPAGAGKSSAARGLARRLGFEFLDTGAMYRAVTLAGLRGGWDFANDAAVAEWLGHVRITLLPGKVLLNDADVTNEIRTPEVTAASGLAAGSRPVRLRLAQLQREIAAGRNMVCEGRDQGTVVFPDAGCKFFITADPHERARRRYEELQARGQVVSFDEVLAAQQARDKRDADRDIAPMKPAPDAILIDTTGLSLEQVVDRLEQEVRRCLHGPPTSGTIPPSS